MDNQKIIDNIMPDAAGTYFAIRNSGYENKNAIADLVDNSIDAGAKNIRITISDDFTDELPQIIIADDGCGMNMDTLRNALRLGKTDHSSNSDLGKYGFGLKSASLSLGRKIKIITKNKNKFSVAVFDYDQIVETNTFYAEFREASQQEIRAFYDRTDMAESGTLLIISNCDRISETKINTFVSSLKDFMRRVFRSYMREGNAIFVNNYSLQYDDPLWLDHKLTKVYFDGDLSIHGLDNKEKTFHVLAVTIPNLGAKGNRAAGFNIKNQGFYFMRNNREIAAGYEIPEIFKKHNDYNFARIEVSFSSDLDDEMNVNFTKHNASPNAAVVAELRIALAEAISEIRKKAKAEQKMKTPVARPIISPLMPGGGSNSPQKPSGEASKTPKGAGTGTPSTEEPSQDFSIDIFDAKEGSFKANEEGGKIKITYNLSGKTYSNKVAKSADPNESRNLLNNLLQAIIDVCKDEEINPVDFLNKLSKKVDN